MTEVSLKSQAPDNSEGRSTLTDPEYLTALRGQMLGFAVSQLSDESLAEEAVQETLAAALQNVGAFRRQAALKTWVFSILKHKIVDILRQRKRFVDSTEDHWHDTLFDARGFWHEQERPAAWTEPSESILNAQFWKVFDACLNGLPETQSRIFMMREFLELSSREICTMENISVSNLHVILHRARLRLRECLENHWFLNGDRR